MKDGKD